MLCEFLNKQINIRCELEILQSHKERKYVRMYAKGKASYGCLESHLKCLEILGDDPSKFVGNRNRKFREFLKIWEDVVPSEYFGFKLFFKNHIGDYKLPVEDSISYENFLKYIKDNDIKIIHLTRDNMLLKYISAITSRATGVHSSSRTSRINSISIEISYKRYLKFKKAILEEEQKAAKFCIENNLPYYHVTYENLVGKNHASFYKAILSHIGEDPELFVDIRDTPQQSKRKTNVYHITHKVSNLQNLIEEASAANDTELLETIYIELAKEK